METPDRLAASPPLPADADGSQSVGQTSIKQLEAQSNHVISPDQRQPRLETDCLELQLQGGRSVMRDFQDSNLSPALHLMPVNSGAEHTFTEYSLFQQSGNDFAPLRAYPDISMASERFHVPLQECPSQLISEQDSLSQHPLTQDTILSEGENSCGSLSQHSLSPRDQGKENKAIISPLINTPDKQEVSYRVVPGTREKDSENVTDHPDKPEEEAAKDETFFLSKDVPAQHLLALLQRDIGMPSGSSSTVSSRSGTSVKIGPSYSDESKSTQPDIDQSTREGPSGEASLPQQQPGRDLSRGQSRALSSDFCNISTGSRSTQPDESSEVLRRELLSEVERCRSSYTQSKNPPKKIAPRSGPSLTPYPANTSEGKESVTRANLGGVPWTGPFSAGVERCRGEQDLWSSGNQTGIDGSYLGFLPQSQSTPGVFKAPQKSNFKAKEQQLSAIESNKENSYQSSTGISPQPALPILDVQPPHTLTQGPEEPTSAKVQSLPSLSYMQKVDAWRSNQKSGKTSLFDSLALQGFSGISPKKKAHDAVSDSLNRILREQVRRLQQPPVSNIASQNVTRNSSTTPSGSSSSRKREAIGGALSDNDNAAPAAEPSASPFGQSRSHSSAGTVVKSVHKDQQTEKEISQTPEDLHHQQSTPALPSTLASLGHFSDVSLDPDLSLSNSQDSHNSRVRFGASIGASSVVSLEVDNYVPDWTSKPSTPLPSLRPREFNIDERIPLYLHNLGIDQSPSTILMPFAPRGPIREPEYSPTDLCTIQGSNGTPAKSTQPSEGGSPSKGDYSRSSIVSADSTMSIPFSMDSLGPAASAPLGTLRVSSSDSEATPWPGRPNAPFSLPDENSHSSTLQTTLQHKSDIGLDSTRNTIEQGHRLDPDILQATEAQSEERDVASTLQTSRTMEQSAETFASPKALMEIGTQHTHLLSDESSVTYPAPRLLSDEDISQSLRKRTSRLHHSSSSSSSLTGDPRTQTSLLLARFSSDSVLTSEKLRESSIGRESMTSSGQPYNSPRQPLICAGASDSHGRRDSTVVRGAGSSFVHTQPARRAEPEGCSAAPPDNIIPSQPAVIRSPPAVSTHQFASTPTDMTAVTEEEGQISVEEPVESSSSSPILMDTDQTAMSDGSSESSLAVRVATLLQSESPTTIVSSTPSTTDQEEGQAIEWIKLKVSGQQCEPLELDSEDRIRIEEIKRELLLKNPLKSQGSTDTVSSSSSSFRVQSGKDLLQQAETFTTLGAVNNLSSQGVGPDLSDSGLQPQNSTVSALEARIREIAAREGVTLTRTNPRPLTSITIATRRRSTSPSSSISPAPPVSPVPELLHLTDLSTGAVQDPVVNQWSPPTTDETSTEPSPVFESSSSFYPSNQNRTSQSAPKGWRRHGTGGGQFEEPPPLPLPLAGEDVKAKKNIQPFRREDSIVGLGHKAGQATSSSNPESPARTGHVSHVHLTLSPKATNCHADAATAPPHKEYVPLRHSSSATVSPDEGVGLSSPLESNERRQPKRTGTSTLSKTSVPHGKITAGPTQSFSPGHSVMVSPRLLNTGSPAVPVLLPYKPHGSEELFYIPITEADSSSSEPSDTTMESTHTGSDDAVPPRFSSEVLGHGDPGLDRGVTIRHTEGIYSKRLKSAAYNMNKSKHRGTSVSAASQTSVSQSPAPKQSTQVAVAFTRAPLSRKQGASKRDQGTSPVKFISSEQPESTRNTFQPIRVETKYDQVSRQSSVPKARRERDQERRESDLPHPTVQQSSSTLDQLWQRFCAQQSLEESRPTGDREASLLERLERLSRLIHGAKDSLISEAEEKPGKKEEDATRFGRKKHMNDVRNGVGFEARETQSGVGEGPVEGKPPVPHQVWTQRLQAEETSHPAEEDSFTSGFSHDSSQSPHFCPADRHQSETLSTTSGSMSTVDTDRLVRVFGADRVQHLKMSTSLSKLYQSIDMQRDGREQRRERTNELHPVVPQAEITITDESTVASHPASSRSSYGVPSLRGPSRTLVGKKAVKLVNKGIQAGDLELVCNGTQRHTRDVGTTFPSPGEARTSRRISSSSSSAEKRRGQRSTSKTRGSQNQRRRISWFISAEELRSDSRKENRPEEEWNRRPSFAWIVPYSRIEPWREPLRQTQVPKDRNQQPSFTHQAQPDLEARTKTLSLQEALRMLRPEFISRSRQRMERLALQAEDRRLQEFRLNRDREEIFCRSGGAGRLPKPAGTSLIMRAVPRKEMIQRSKQIYENLPEVQRKRQEERRRAEYRSYRMNAQFYNKKITSRVLGRRKAWQ